MTNNWDFYQLRVDDNPASMFVDLGIHKFAPKHDFPFSAYIRLRMNSPRSDGLSSQEEFDTLQKIEDTFTSTLAEEFVEYVGRCTTNSCRDYYFYLKCDEDWETKVISCMAPFSEYSFEYGSREDKSWSTYFSYLYPSDRDLHKIRNMRVCEALENRGDKLVVAREIDHWSYFADEEQMNSYIEEALQLGFQLRNVDISNRSDLRHVARVWRLDIPDFDSINEITLPLYEAALEYDGEYDGWECEVVA